MPTEILEKIVAFAIPDKVEVSTWYRIKSWDSSRDTGTGSKNALSADCCLNPWVSGMLLVSKAIRQVSRANMAYRTEFDVIANSAHFNQDLPTEVEKKVKEYFKELLTRNEEHGLPARATL
jgi:hypothetical protein